jgi:hypothetical protein
MVTVEDGFGNVETVFDGSVTIATRAAPATTPAVTLAVTASQNRTFSRRS